MKFLIILVVFGWICFIGLVKLCLIQVKWKSMRHETCVGQSYDVIHLRVLWFIRPEICCRRSRREVSLVRPVIRNLYNNISLWKWTRTHTSLRTRKRIRRNLMRPVLGFRTWEDFIKSNTTCTLKAVWGVTREDFLNLQIRNGTPPVVLLRCFLSHNLLEAPRRMWTCLRSSFRVFTWVRMNLFRCPRLTLCRKRSMSCTRYLLSSSCRHQLTRHFGVGWTEGSGT
jgi:hypothetical protein